MAWRGRARWAFCAVSGEREPALPCLTAKSHDRRFLLQPHTLSGKTPCRAGGHDFTRIHGQARHFLPGPEALARPPRRAKGRWLQSPAEARRALAPLPGIAPLLTQPGSAAKHSAIVCGSQGSECPCSRNWGSSAGMNEAFSRTRLYE